MDALERLAATLGTDPIEVPLGDKTIRIKPPMDWRDSALDALMQGRYRVWASTSLVNDEAKGKDGKITGSDDFEIWKSVDPTMGQILDLMVAYRNSGGVGLGE